MTRLCDNLQTNTNHSHKFTMVTPVPFPQFLNENTRSIAQHSIFFLWRVPFRLQDSQIEWRVDGRRGRENGKCRGKNKFTVAHGLFILESGLCSVVTSFDLRKRERESSKVRGEKKWEKTKTMKQEQVKVVPKTQGWVKRKHSQQYWRRRQLWLMPKLRSFVS